MTAGTMSDTRKIIQNAYILSCDEHEPGGIGTVTIRNDRMTSVSYGRSRDDSPAPDVEVIDGTGKILLPGFVDLHVHGESLIFDLLTAGEPQSRWARLDAYTRAESFWYQRAGFEDWKTLYTTVGYQALRSGVTYLGEFGVPGGDDPCLAALEAFSRTELAGMLTVHDADQLERVQQRSGRGLRFSIALPPAEELTTYNLQASLRLSKESGYPLVVHCNDAPKDAEVIQKNFGKGIVPLLDEFGVLDAGCLLMHLHPDDPKQIQRLSARSAGTFISPGGAGRKGFPVPDPEVFAAAGIQPALCTDWGTFSHWSTMKSLAERYTLLHSKRAPVLEYLRGLTIGPSRAIGMATEMGSIVPGKIASLQMIQCRDLYLQGVLDRMSPADLAETMVRRVSSSDVTDVMVSGEFSIREGMVLTYSEEDIVRDIQDLLDAPDRDRTRKAEEADVGPDRARLHEEQQVRGIEKIRIIRRSEEELVKGTILPLDTARDMKANQPKPVRRVFGEDDM